MLRHLIQGDYNVSYTATTGKTKLPPHPGQKKFWYITRILVQKMTIEMINRGYANIRTYIKISPNYNYTETILIKAGNYKRANRGASMLKHLGK